MSCLVPALLEVVDIQKILKIGKSVLFLMKIQLSRSTLSNPISSTSDTLFQVVPQPSLLQWTLRYVALRSTAESSLKSGL